MISTLYVLARKNTYLTLEKLRALSFSSEVEFILVASSIQLGNCCFTWVEGSKLKPALDDQKSAESELSVREYHRLLEGTCLYCVTILLSSSCSFSASEKRLQIRRNASRSSLGRGLSLLKLPFVRGSYPRFPLFLRALLDTKVLREETKGKG